MTRIRAPGRPRPAGRLRLATGVWFAGGSRRLAMGVWLAAGAWLPGATSDLVAQEACLAPGARIGLDHVPIAVSDLEAASEQLTRGFGFRTKPGRLHPGGVENRHIKFADGTGLELVTVWEAGDEVARAYAELIADGGGGAFLALSGVPVDSVVSRAGAAGAGLTVTRSTAFDIASFPPGHPLRAVFFVDIHRRPPDLPEHIEHPNGAAGLRGVWVAAEHPDRLVAFLERFGGRACGTVAHPFHLTGRAVGLSNGTVYVVDAGEWEADPGSAPVLSVTVGGATAALDREMVLQNAGGLWVEVRAPPRP